MTQRPCTAILLLAALLILPSSNLLALESEGTLEKIARTGEFLIGYRTDSSPLSYENADGQPSGYSVDLCRRVAAGVKAFFGEKDIETKFVRITSDERISAVVNGKIDIECGSTTITLSRQEKVDFSLPTFVTGGSALSLASSGIQSMSDLSGKKVGVAKDTTTVEQLQNHLQQNLIDAEIVIVDDRNEGMKRLNRGDIDALASDQIVLIGQVIEALNPKRYSLVSEVFSYEPYGFVVRRNDADFRLVVNKAIAQLYRSGQHAEIFYKWIGRIGITVPPILAAMYQLNALPE
ncbi:MAG: amino acid ABC transporter substrate-binding protein [Gammaproteobacteria bacterium]|nr:amino acid ABC transporter substrate-binding protein [Gammaproteobacteria bacterium]